MLVTEVGASPLQLARTRRAQLARVLLDQTALPMPDVAFAAGFASIRQFNDVMRAEFGAPPTALRARAGRSGSAGWTAPPGTRTTAPATDAGDGPERVPVEGAEIALRLRHALPLDAPGWLAHVGHRAVPGLERVEPDGSVTRLLRAAGGPVRVTVAMADDGAQVLARLRLGRLADLGGVVGRLRRWMDLDADPAAVDAALAGDPLLAPLVAQRPGLRIPGTVDPFELAVRAVLGQQVSTTGARTLASRLVEAFGGDGADGLRLFPTAETLAAAGPGRLRALGLTGARAATLVALAAAVADGLVLDPLADREAARAALLRLPGIGPWTADYVAMRALGHPDVFLPTDVGVRRAIADLGHAPDPVIADSERWRPWRSYALMHLWNTLMPTVPDPTETTHSKED